MAALDAYLHRKASATQRLCAEKNCHKHISSNMEKISKAFDLLVQKKSQTVLAVLTGLWLFELQAHTEKET